MKREEDKVAKRNIKSELMQLVGHEDVTIMYGPGALVGPLTYEGEQFYLDGVNFSTEKVNRVDIPGKKIILQENNRGDR